MGVPSLAVQVQGVGSASADNLNTFIQGANVVSQLRTITGISGMKIYVAGQAVIGDGGSGTYYWNPSATAADNGSTIIAPTGVATGRWMKLPQSPTITVSTAAPTSSDGVDGDVWFQVPI